MTRTNLALAAAASLLGAACGATVQDMRAMTRDLSVQLSRLEESVARETGKAREALQKEIVANRQATEEVAQGIVKSRAATSQDIAALRARIDELASIVLALKRGAQTGGSQSAFAELDVRAIGEGHYRVSRKQFKDYAYELTRLASQVPLVAQFDKDKRVGLRLVESNGFLGRFGILPGDVLTRINDLPLRSPDQTREILRTVRDVRDVTIKLRRADENQTIRITVAD